MTEIVNGVLLRDRQVLMARRAATRQSYPDTWSFPGGHVEKGETLLAALQREMLEEIGVTTTAASYDSQFDDIAGGPLHAVKFHFFIIRDWDRDPRNLGDEHSALRWVDLRDAARLPDLALACYPDLFTRLLARHA